MGKTPSGEKIRGEKIHGEKTVGKEVVGKRPRTLLFMARVRSYRFGFTIARQNSEVDFG